MGEKAKNYRDRKHISDCQRLEVEGGQEGTFRVMEMLYILMTVVVTQPVSISQNSRTLH